MGDHYEEDIGMKRIKIQHYSCLPLAPTHMATWIHSLKTRSQFLLICQVVLATNFQECEAVLTVPNTRWLNANHPGKPS